MKLYPVILCGGAGTRLWPASRPSRPKQFIPLAGNRSLFYEAVIRVSPLVSEGARLIVVGASDHRALILDQLDEAGIDAQVLLEPVGRDSAAAMAAAAVWTAAHDIEGINVFVASDHFIPDSDAFRSSVIVAAKEAQSGRIVTLGIKPTKPSTAYGYIHPVTSGLSKVAEFVEKPDRRTAEKYIENGYLWNSGNFIVSASVLLKELSSQAASVDSAARAAVSQGVGDVILNLGDAFQEAPRVSIDYAVMEKTKLASVLAVDFDWSDLGAWDAIAASGEGEIGSHIFEDAEGCLARAPDGMVVAAIGVRDLAIIVERDAVLVCDLRRSQEVKKIVERIRLSSPQHADFFNPSEESLADGSQRLKDWLRTRSLPLWSALGQREDGCFAESLTLDGRWVDAARTARTQAYQIHAFAQVGMMGWGGPWARAVRGGLKKIDDDCARPDQIGGSQDQAFRLLALAAAFKAGVAGADVLPRGESILNSLLKRGVPGGDLLEEGAAFQSGFHMHLLAAVLAWEEVSAAPVWRDAADRIVRLACVALIDTKSGRLRGCDERLASLSDGLDYAVEPGHQFEWACLLARYATARNDGEALATAHRLHARGREGVSERRQLAVNALSDDGEVLRARARLWPQTEWLKSSLILAHCVSEHDRAAYMADASEALRALWLYLTPDGLWRDTLLESGKFIEEPSPASSLYHIVAAFAQLADSALVDSEAWAPSAVLR